MFTVKMQIQIESTLVSHEIWAMFGGGLKCDSDLISTDASQSGCSSCSYWISMHHSCHLSCFCFYWRPQVSDLTDKTFQMTTQIVKHLWAYSENDKPPIVIEGPSSQCCGMAPYFMLHWSLPWLQPGKSRCAPTSCVTGFVWYDHRLYKRWTEPLWRHPLVSGPPFWSLEFGIWPSPFWLSWNRMWMWLVETVERGGAECWVTPAHTHAHLLVKRIPAIVQGWFRAQRRKVAANKGSFSKLR